MDPWLLSLTGTVAMYITLGPNNVTFATSAANHGNTATVPLVASLVPVLAEGW